MIGLYWIEHSDPTMLFTRYYTTLLGSFKTRIEGVSLQ